MARTLYLVRHGTTRANLENRFAGRTAAALHETGVRQVEDVGTRLQACDIVRIYSGPLLRVRQSAEILRTLLDVPVVFDEALTEILIAHWDGLTKKTIIDSFGDEYPTWLDRPQHFALPGCETLAQVQARSSAALESYLDRAPAGNLLIVSHLIVIRCLVLYFKKLGLADFRRIKIDNGSVVRVTEGADGGWSVVLQDWQEAGGDR
jgi:broad specificity phosphatase PhoE